LVHRFLTYLSRESNRACPKKLTKKFWVFRLATMFYAPVYLPHLPKVPFSACACLFSKEAK